MLLILFFTPTQEQGISTIVAGAFALLASFVAFVRTVKRRLPALEKREKYVAWSIFYELASVIAVTICSYAFYKNFGLLEGDKPVTRPLDFLYFSVVTWTTLGYRDLRPSSDVSKVFAASEAIFGYAFMGLYFALAFHALAIRSKN